MMNHYRKLSIQRRNLMEGVFELASVLTPGECNALVQAAKSAGFESLEKVCEFFCFFVFLFYNTSVRHHISLMASIVVPEGLS